MEMENGYSIVHIPGINPFPPHLQPTVNVVASDIDPEFASPLVRRLNHIAPLENLRHIKRVRKKYLENGKIKLSVILCIASEIDCNWEKILSPIIECHNLSPFITKVSQHAATSKEQWVEQCKLWPTSYHPPTYNIDGITGFCEEETELIFRFMKLVVEMSQRSGDHQQVLVNAAVIVDPSLKQVIATARDHTCSCSTEKDVEETGPFMGTVKIENDNKESFGKLNDYTSVRCLYPGKWAELKTCHKTASCGWHPLGHAVMAVIELSSAQDRLLFPRSGPAPLVCDEIIDIDKANFDRPYLCTGYDIFLLFEPCIMCAMALVHQRFRRIFYVFSNRLHGALGGASRRLQGENSLNHHYAVFRVSLPPHVLMGGSGSSVGPTHP